MHAYSQYDRPSPYWSLAITSTFTLYNTFIYTTLILISKGFCITREFLERGEVTIVAMTMGAVYLGFSAFMIEQEKMIPLLVIMLTVLFYLTAKFTKSIIVALDYRRRDLIINNARPMVPSIIRKIRMMKAFLFFVYFYFTEQLMTKFLNSIGLVFDSCKYNLVIETVAEMTDIMSILGIFFIFRARDLGNYFYINELPSNLQHQPIAPFLEAKIPMATEYSQIIPGHPLVILDPQEYKIGI